MRTSGHGAASRIIALILCLALSPLPLMAQGAQAAGQVTAMVPAATRNANPTKVKEEVFWNDLIKTERSGRVRLGLRDGSILSVGSESQLKVVQHDAASQQTQIELNYGKLRSRVVQLTKPGAKFEVRTPTAVAGVVGTDFMVEFNPATNVLTIIVYSGIVTITGLGALAGQSATVNAGQMINITQNGFGTPQPTPPQIQQESISQTTTEGAKAAGAGSHLLRNILIGLGVAVASIAIGVGTTGSKDDTRGEPPPP